MIEIVLVLPFSGSKDPSRASDLFNGGPRSKRESLDTFNLDDAVLWHA